MPRGGSGWQPSVWHERFLWGALIVVVILMFSFLTAAVCHTADLPEYADLTFVDQADLDKQVDSVLAVCNTVFLTSDSSLSGYSLWYCSPYDTLEYFYYRYDITCRRWAGLTVYEMPKETWADGLINPRTGLIVIDVNPGKARLYWWEKEE